MNTRSVPGTVLGAEDTEITKMNDMISATWWEEAAVFKNATKAVKCHMSPDCFLFHLM
jgi:hypothetical protein